MVVAPALIPLATALTLLALPRRSSKTRSVSLAGCLALLVSAVALLTVVTTHDAVSVAFGGWALPFAIEFKADRLSAAFVLLAALAGLTASGAARDGTDTVDGRVGSQPLVHGLLAGACGAFLTADLFNLYVWLEVVLVASLGLLAREAKPEHLDAAFRYLVLNVVGTLFLLIGVVSIYAVTGHLNFSSIRQAVDALPRGAIAPYASLLAMALLVKAAAFPVFAWLPATYHTLPPSQAALVSAIGTKIGVYALLRLRMDVVGSVTAGYDAVLAWVAAATMVVGVLGAAHHWDMRRILAFHSVSQIGYMLLGMALGTVAGVQALLVFALHHGLVKSNLFLVAALIRRTTGSYDLRHCGGVLAARPALGMLFLLQALSLVGVPPLSGFWAKLLVVRATVGAGHIGLAAIALGVGTLTLYSMIKIWVEAFWKPHPGQVPDGDEGEPRLAAVAWAVAAVTLALGLWPEPLIVFAADAAHTLMGVGRP